MGNNLVSDEAVTQMKQMWQSFIANKGKLKPAQTRKGRRGGSGDGGIRLAYPQETPEATQDISCRLDGELTGPLVTVTVDPIWSGGGDLDTAEPALTEGGDPFWVKKVGTTWRNVTTFHKVGNCAAEECE